MTHPLLSIENLTVDFGAGPEKTRAVDNISLTINRNEIVAIVGESGSGKSVTSLSILQLLRHEKKHFPGGKLLFSANGSSAVDLLAMPEPELRKIRGAAISMIFQEPMSSLNPVFSCGDQVMEAILEHQKSTRGEARKKTIELFKQVRLPDPERVLAAYPHEISGGQKQRVMIAMAISCNPALLIADEPTTALDVTVQKSILELLASLQEQTNMGLVFISHDLGIVQDIAHKVVVMYKGKIVEQNITRELFSHPRHPYTQALLACRPVLYKKGQRLPVVTEFWQPNRVGEIKNGLSESGLSNQPGLSTEPSGSGEPLLSNELALSTESILSSDQDQSNGPMLQGKVMPTTEPASDQQSTPKTLLKVEDLRLWFPTQRNIFGKPTRFIRAVDGVNFEVMEGETLGIVGESGCGKTTLGRAILRLVPATHGHVWHNGRDLLSLAKKDVQEFRKEFQIVFQDPYASLNPRITIGEAIGEAMRVHGIGHSIKSRKDQVMALLEKVNLDSGHYNRFPYAFSGGQRQRIGIARALALNPGFIVFDESVSALDVSVQAQVLNLINDLKREYGFTAIFISHDLGVVKYISDRILVMKSGGIEEIGTAESIFQEPQSAYTRTLLESIPGNRNLQV